MQLGNNEITRDMMPSFSWKDADPDYLYSSFQDVFFKAKQTQAPAMIGGNVDNKGNEQSSWEMK